MFKVSEESHPFFDKLRVTDWEEIEELSLTELFENRDEEGDLKPLHFYHYQGSLTTPPLIETVNWFVYKEVLPISDVHLKLLQVHCFDD